MSSHRRGRKYKAKHMENFISNMTEVDKLLQIHGRIAGDTAGRKYDVSVLNKSGVVLLVACWEACMEDLVCAAFDILMKNAKDHTAFPPKARTLASNTLREANDRSQVWRLADDGWRSVMRDNREKVFEEYAGKLNTPRPRQLDKMFQSMIGLNTVSSSWHWNRMKISKAQEKLNQLVTLRGSIAHRVTTAKAVHKNDVRQYAEFVTRLAVATHNHVHAFLERRLKFGPWNEYEYS